MARKLSHSVFMAWTNRQRKTGERICLSMHLTPQAFKKMPDEKNPIYLGWEWEIGSIGGEDVEAAYMIRKAMSIPELRRYVNFGHYGRPIEMRSIPATMQFHRDYMTRSFFGNAMQKYMVPNGWCGMHVHIDKKAFVDEGVHKFIRFITLPENNAFIRFIAGRAVSERSEWCKPLGHTQKESAVNTETDFDTIELRIFKSPLTERKFLANLEFTDALVKYANAHSFADMRTGGFVKWVLKRENEYPNLSTIIKRKGVKHELVKVIHKKAKAKGIAKRPKVSKRQVA